MEIVAIAYGWRLVFYLEFGDIRAAEADLDALTRVDVRIRQPTYSIAMRSYHIMFALMRGELAETERRIMQSMALQRTGLTNHEDQLSVMIFTLRREQGRLREFRPVLSVVSAPAAGCHDLAAGAGADLRRDRAARRRACANSSSLAANDFAAIARDGRWHFCMVYLSEVCAALGDAARAAALYRMLLPYAGRNLILGRPGLLRIGGPLPRTALRHHVALDRGRNATSRKRWP